MLRVFTFPQLQPCNYILLLSPPRKRQRVKLHYFINSSVETPNALAILRNVSMVGLLFMPASMLIMVLLETSASRASFSWDKPCFSAKI